MADETDGQDTGTEPVAVGTDPRATRAVPVKDANVHPGIATLYQILADAEIASAAQNWPRVLSEAARAEPVAQKYTGVQIEMPRSTAPLMAHAQAKLGDVGAAEAMIARTPANCYAYLMARSRIGELRGQRARDDWWFARATQQAPSIPMVYSDWGQSMLETGDFDGAIAKFTLANQKGPHFADPFEMWAKYWRRRSSRICGEVHRGREILPKPGPTESEMGRGAGLCRVQR